jgi:hypothetical protein
MGLFPGSSEARPVVIGRDGPSVTIHTIRKFGPKRSALEDCLADLATTGTRNRVLGERQMVHRPLS